MRYRDLVICGSSAQQIVALDQEYDRDLIAICRNASRVTEQLLPGSLTKHVRAGSQFDMLVVREPRNTSE